MQNELKLFQKDDFTKANKLFTLANELHNAYYVWLIQQLSITGKFLMQMEINNWMSWFLHLNI